MSQRTGDLVVDDLTVEYTRSGHQVRPIDRLSMRATPGSLVLLLGPSGCGKTTLLSCLAGILRPTSGRVVLGDTDVTALKGASLTEYRRNGVGIVFQAFNLIASMTALENVMLPMRSAGMRSRAAHARALELLGDVDLAGRLGHRPGELSGGQQQRIAVARALALDPPLVVADEPTAHLDQANLEGVLRLLRQLTRNGRIVVVSTHDDRLLPLADQILELAPRPPVTEPELARIELADGQLLFQTGDTSNWVYTVVSGAVELLVPTAQGAFDLVRTVEPGGWFGEMGPLFHLPRSATARASGQTVVEACTVASFRERIDTKSLAMLISRTV